GASQSLHLVIWLMAIGLLVSLGQVVWFVHTNYRTALRTRDFFLLAGWASLYGIWLVGLIATCAFVWQAGRCIGVLGPDCIDYWWNQVQTWYIWQRLASDPKFWTCVAALSRIVGWLHSISKRIGAGVAAINRVCATTSGWRGALLRTATLLLPLLLYG